MVARVVPQSARRRHAESRKPDLWGVSLLRTLSCAPPALPGGGSSFTPPKGYRGIWGDTELTGYR